LVKREDIVCYDLDGNAVSQTSERPYLERFIHSEIYRARPDVVAVVHSHSPSVIPFAITHKPLKPVFHMSGFLGSGSAHFEIREAAGNTDMLIRSPYLGEALAKSLGKHNCVLMRGHGSTVVGTSLEQVVYRAIYTENNARLQAMSMPLGEVSYLTDGEASATAEMNDQHLDRPWQMWKRDALASR
jgi:HCOMODA/2-hydroxy-3-carboxy-muconic semialdehyde decarboxylase